jgi:hypothetical protein
MEMALRLRKSLRFLLDGYFRAGVTVILERLDNAEGRHLQTRQQRAG